MTPTTTEEITEVLGDEVEESIIERIAAVGASLDEIGEAIDDLDYERRYGETREASSSRVEEVRTILEEISAPPVDEPDAEAEEENEGLTIIEPDELAREAS